MSHKQHDIFTERKQFQIERIILFSDAVFAIAITLLVIEIKVPVSESIQTLPQIKEALAHKGGEFFGLLLSFAVIGQFWTNHHKLFGLVTNYDKGLIWLNLHMLFWIILVPFTSGLNSHYFVGYVWQIYSFNLFMIGLSIYFIYRHIGNPKRKLSILCNDVPAKKYAYMRSLSTSFIFLLSFVIAFSDTYFGAWACRLVLLLIIPVIIIINRMAQKKRSAATER